MSGFAAVQGSRFNAAYAAVQGSRFKVQCGCAAVQGSRSENFELGVSPLNFELGEAH